MGRWVQKTCRHHEDHTVGPWYFQKARQRSVGNLGDVPSGYVKIAIEHTPFIVDLPLQNGDFL